MPELKVSLFGSPSIRVDGVEYGTDRRKSVALLAYLIETGREHSREQLADLFWPDYPRESTLAYLRRTLWELNNGLGKGWIKTARGKIGFDAIAGAVVDTHDFRREKSAAEVSDDPIPGLERVRDLYRGDFLADFYLQDAAEFEDWQRLQAENYRREYAEVLERLAERRTALGEWEKALDAAQAWLMLDTINENPHRLLMRIYNDMGDRAGVVRQYELCRAELMEAVGLGPAAETTALYQRLVQGGAEEKRLAGPARETAAGTTGLHLPSPATPFIGRRHEVERIKDLLLSSNNRLVTLMGPGGSGKTRLAIQTAAEAAGRFPDGVWFVPLATVVAAEDIIPALARSLNFNFYREEERPRRQLLDYLREKDLLLTLDNLEQLVGPETNELFGEILGSSDRVKLLITSRTRLNVPGEQLYTVGGMQLPGAEQAAGWVDPAAEAGKFSALQLFFDRARRVRPDFELTPDNIRAVVETCRLVAGMPLGIELAASWLELLGPEEIAAEIRRSLDFLETDQPAVPERQRSIRAVFDYSWKMLSEIERDAFLALSVFSGSFTREAAQAISGASLRTLLALVNKSWLLQQDDGRFQLHPLLAHYGHEKLAVDERAVRSAREKHAVYFAKELRRQSDRMKGPEQYDAVRELDVEIDNNIRIAWDWTVQERRWSVLLDDFLLGLFQYGNLRWQTVKLISWMREVREILDPEAGRDELLAYVVMGALESYFEQTWIIHENSPEKRVAAIWRLVEEQGLAVEMGFWFFILAVTYAVRSHDPIVQEHIDLAIERLRAGGMNWELGISLLFASNSWISDITRINREYVEEAWAIFEKLDVIFEKATVIELFAELARKQGRPHQEVLEAFLRAQELFLRGGDRMGAANIYQGLASLFEHRAGIQKNIEYRSAQREIYRSYGSQISLANSYHWEGNFAYRYGTFEHALEAEQTGLAIFEREVDMPSGTWMAWAYHSLGEIYRVFGHRPEALGMYARAEAVFDRLDYPLGKAYIRRSYGDDVFVDGRYAEALEHYQAYLALATDEGHFWSIAEAHARLSWVHARLKNIDAARQSIAATLGIAIDWREAYLEILVLLGEAYCLSVEGSTDQAVELAAWIHTHPCTWNEVVDHTGRLLDELGVERPVVPENFTQEQVEGVDVRERTRRWLDGHPTHRKEPVI